MYINRFTKIIFTIVTILFNGCNQTHEAPYVPYEKYLDGNAPTVVWKMIIPPTKKI